MPKDTKTLGNSTARACESLGFVHKKGCARVLTQPHIFLLPLLLFPFTLRYGYSFLRFIDLISGFKYRHPTSEF